MRVLGRFRRMRHGLTSIFAGRNEEEACFETARSARGFSRNALAVLDDKLAFSATLMRAGEVDAAMRMMREAEAEVLHEETVLLERVQDVAAAGSTPRARMTRLRLARLLATTLLSASVMVFSIFGFALAGVIVERLAPADVVEAGGTRTVDAVGASDTPDKRVVRTVRVAGKEVRLGARHYRTYRAIASGDTVSPHEVSALLLGLPLGKVNALLAGLPPEVANALRESVGIPPVAMELLSQVKETATKDKESTAESEPQDSSTSEPSEDSSSDSSTSTEADSEGSHDSGRGSGGGGGGGGGGRSNNGGTELNLEDLLNP